MTYYDTIFCIHLCRLFANLGEFSFGNSIKEAIAFVQSLFSEIHVEATEWLKNEQMTQEKNKSYAETMKRIC